MARTLVPPLAPALALALALAGCITLPEDPDLPEREPIVQGGGSMTADATKTEGAQLCTDGGLLGGRDDGMWCAKRVITVTGKISGLDRMDVQLDSFNGDVVAKAGSGSAWGFVATLTAKGSNEADAIERLDEIDLRWVHELDGLHVVHVEARHEGRSGQDLGAAIEATLPSAITYDLSAASANGDVQVGGLTTSLLNAATSNGDVEATASFVHANLATSNGDVVATLTPLRTGDINVGTSNGKIDVKVPESARYGYRLEGATSNGEVQIDLRDGEKGPCPEGSQYYTPPCNHRTFATTGYEAREIRVMGYFATSNGSVQLSPS